MSTLQGDEPDLALGDTGEHVIQLQDRLRGLGLLDRFPDGTFDDATETAVRQLQSEVQVTADGQVRRDTWEALDAYMLQHGLTYNPYAGAGQQHWDLAAADPVAADAPAADAPAAEPAFIPKLEHVHPAIREDTRFASFHEFLTERG